MSRNLLIFIGLLLSFIITQNNISAEIITSIPIKKPTLTTEELDKKISKNVLKPPKKPQKSKGITVREKEIDKKEIKPKRPSPVRVIGV